jgi:hypothetical protein
VKQGKNNYKSETKVAAVVRPGIISGERSVNASLKHNQNSIGENAKNAVKIQNRLQGKPQKDAKYSQQFFELRTHRTHATSRTHRNSINLASSKSSQGGVVLSSLKAKTGPKEAAINGEYAAPPDEVEIESADESLAKLERPLLRVVSRERVNPSFHSLRKSLTGNQESVTSSS